MIYLPDVANALEQLLNNNFINQSAENPAPYLFKVAVNGFHVDSNYDKEAKQNFIPVYIDALGGNYDAVKNVKRAVKNITVTFFFPVRFKNDFFAMDDFFVDNFVAEIVDFGGITGKCLCNVSVPQFGEIQDLDLTQFKEWVNDTYKMPIETMIPYLSMQFTIYLTTQAEGFLLGNNVNYTLKFSVDKQARENLIVSLLPYRRNQNLDRRLDDGYDYYAWSNGSTTYYTRDLYFDNNEPYYSISNGVATKVGNDGSGSGEVSETFTLTENLVWTSSGTGVSNSPIAQQLIDVEDYAKNAINITNYNKSIVAYVRDNPFWDNLLEYYNLQKITDLYNVQLIKQYKFEKRIKQYTYDQVTLSLNENVSLGDLVSFTITFGDEYKEGSQNA